VTDDAPGSVTGLEQATTALNSGRIEHALRLFEEALSQGQISDELVFRYARAAVATHGGYATLQHIHQSAYRHLSGWKPRFMFLVLVSIAAWCAGDMVRLHRVFTALRVLLDADVGLADLPAPQVTYYRYVYQLCRFWQSHRSLYVPDASAPAGIHVIGDSHALAFANLATVVGRVCAEFVYGLKAHHLGTGPNGYRGTFELRLRSIPRDSQVLIVCGEIDCRQGEGIADVVRKTGRSLDHVVEDTVHAYVRYLEGLHTGHSLQVVGVTACADDPARLPAVLQFNRTLERHCAEAGIPFHDALPMFLTGNRTDGAAMLDQYHLTPAACLAILDRMSASPAR
jgi:hypothetical protein